MRDQRILKKIAVWLPAIAVVSVIIGLTLQNIEQTGNLTNSVRQTIIATAESNGITREQVVESWWSNPNLLRKSAHFFEFLWLGVTTMFGVINSWDRKQINISIAICLGVSLLDQIVKNFVPGREFDLTDLPLDFLGYMVGSYLILFIYRRLIKEKKE